MSDPFQLDPRLAADTFLVGETPLNQVAQLHVHHIARFHADDAWPGPVWGVGSAVPYSDPALEVLKGELRSLLQQPLSLTGAT